MWARGYFAVSTGDVTDEIIKQYIDSHKETLDPDNNFHIGDEKL